MEPLGQTIRPEAIQNFDQQRAQRRVGVTKGIHQDDVVTRYGFLREDDLAPLLERVAEFRAG